MLSFVGLYRLRSALPEHCFAKFRACAGASASLLLLPRCASPWGKAWEGEEVWELHGGGDGGKEGEGMEFRVEAAEVPGLPAAGRSAPCFPRALLCFGFRQRNRGGLAKIISCSCGFIAAVISALLSKLGSLSYLLLQEVNF